MVAHIQKDRFKTINELIEQSEYFFLDELPAYDDKSVKKHFNSGTADLLTEISTGFQQLNDWKAEHIQSVIDQYIESSGLKLGKVAPPIRIAVTGSTNSPSIDITLELIGQPLVIKRLQSAIEFIKQNRLDQ
jgi:glutamyl-tRNA synthetase